MIWKYITYNGQDNSTSLPGKSQHSPCCVRAELWWGWDGVMVGKCHGISVWNCIKAKTLWVFGNKLGWPFRFHGPLNVCGHENLHGLGWSYILSYRLGEGCKAHISILKRSKFQSVSCDVSSSWGIKDYFWSSFRDSMRFKWATFSVCRINIIATIHFKRHSCDYYFDTKI